MIAAEVVTATEGRDATVAEAVATEMATVAEAVAAGVVHREGAAGAVTAPEMAVPSLRWQYRPRDGCAAVAVAVEKAAISRAVKVQSSARNDAETMRNGVNRAVGF